MHRALVVLMLALPLSARATKRPSEAPPVEAVAALLGVGFDPAVELDSAQREIARRAGHRLVSLCPDCRLVTIGEEGPCGWARAQRTIIKNAVKKGLTEEQIVAAYVKAYGTDILALREDSTLGIASWSIPYALALAGLAAALLIARRLANKRAQEAAEIRATDEDRRDLARALEDLD